MSSVNNCPHCGQQVRIPDAMLGRLVRCPLCGQAFTAGSNQIPDAAYPVQSVEPHRGGLSSLWAFSACFCAVFSALLPGTWGPRIWIKCVVG